MATDVERILEELENLVLEATRVPLTKKRMIEEEPLSVLMDELRLVLPNELKHARQVLNEQQRIIQEAQQEAKRIIEQAREKAEAMVREEPIMQEAQEKSRNLLMKSQQESESIRGAADAYAAKLQKDATDYANEIFSYIEATLQKTQEVVAQGHASLQHSAKREPAVVKSSRIERKNGERS